MNEIWKDVVGYEGLYEVSSFGSIRNTKTKRELKPMFTRTGYAMVWLYGKDHLQGRNGKAFQVHRIVANAFCQKDTLDCEVNHINENKSDNRACNLEWCTHKENSLHGTRGARIGRSNLNGKQSRAVVQLTLNGEFVREFPSLAEIKRNTGFNHKNICRLLKGKGETAYGYKWQYASLYNNRSESV